MKREIYITKEYGQVPLTKGKLSKIDLEDVFEVSKFNWNFSSHGYAVRRGQFDGGARKTIFLHRFINKTPEGMETDHINGDKLDNRRVNLRSVTAKQNQHNTKSHKRSSSKYKGVHWVEKNGNWQANIKVSDKIYYLGSFDSEIGAAESYDIAAAEFHGEFVRLNFPSQGRSV